MAVITVTDVPQRIYHSSYGDTGNPSQVGIQIKNGVTGTVYLAKNQARCVAQECNYITENTAVFSVELKAGGDVWAVVDTGLSVDIIVDDFGPGA